MLAQFTEKLELKFWDICIPVLTKATWLRWFFQQISMIKSDEHQMRKIASALVIACVGTASGILLYTLSILLS
jgi:hypothetical protein